MKPDYPILISTPKHGFGHDVETMQSYPIDSHGNHQIPISGWDGGLHLWLGEIAVANQRRIDVSPRSYISLFTPL